MTVLGDRNSLCVLPEERTLSAPSPLRIEVSVLNGLALMGRRSNARTGCEPYLRVLTRTGDCPQAWTEMMGAGLRAGRLSPASVLGRCALSRATSTDGGSNALGSPRAHYGAKRAHTSRQRAVKTHAPRAQQAPAPAGGRRPIWRFRDELELGQVTTVGPFCSGRLDVRDTTLRAVATIAALERRRM